MAKESVIAALNDDDKLIERTPLNNIDIMALMNHCMQANIFQFGGCLYKQICGVPMGSPISVVIAEMTMQLIEK